MELFDIDANTMINLEHIDAVRMEEVGKEKVIIVIVNGVPYKIEQNQETQKEFFILLMKKGARPHKQFTSI